MVTGLIPVNVVAEQSDILTLENLLEQEDVSSNDIDQIFEIIRDLIRNNDDDIETYLESALSIAETNRYFKGIYSYLQETHRYFSDSGQYTLAKEKIEETYGRYASSFSAEQKNGVEILFANLLYETGDVNHSYQQFREIFQKTSKVDDLAYIRINYGAIYRDRGEYDKSIENYLLALEYYNEVGDVYGQMDVNSRLGVTYYDVDDFETSLKFYRVAQELAMEVQNEKKIVMINSNMATSYRRNGQYELALKYMEENLIAARNQNNYLAVAQNLMNISNVYSGDIGDHSKALEYNAQSLEISRAQGLTYGIVLNYMSIGRNYHRQGKYTQALVSYDSAMTYSTIMELGHISRQLTRLTSEAYAGAGNFEQALNYHQQFHELITNQFSEDRNRAILEIQTKYESDLKDQDLAHNDILASEQRAQIMYLSSSLVLLGLGAFGFIMFLIYRNRTMKILYHRNKELLESFDKINSIQVENVVEQIPHFQLFKRIAVLFDKEEIYTQTDLSVRKVADQLSSNEKYISRAISTHANMNFSNFLNEYRINKARKMMSRADNTFRINEIMYECGYSSSSTFYSAFKKITGMTPKQFMAMAGEEAGGNMDEKNM